ncbi:MAG TPA: leucyl aminopeptidase [Gemmatimonadales bacterium]
MTLTMRVVAAAPAGYATPLLAVLLSDTGLPASLSQLDGQTNGAVSRLMAAGDFKGKRDETALLYPDGPAARILLVGLGKADAADRNTVRRGVAVAVKRARHLGVTSAAVHLAADVPIGVRAIAQAAAEGSEQGAWRYEALKQPSEDQKPELDQVDLLLPGKAEDAEAGARVGAAIGAGHALARGLQVLPGNLCTPSFLAATAQEIAARHGFKVTVLDRAQIEAEGMGALMAVAKGSAEEPRFIVLEHDGKGGAPVVLVGKGITFDTGGISIKPAERMEDMKYDMSGAAAVLGTFEALGRLRPAARVVGLIPTCENMPSSRAYKPGDVVRSHFGKTIEVVNTDAEGRLILCDALSYARRFQPACVIDAATLTGAVTIALGHAAAAVLGTDPELVRQLREAGERAGERVWELPLWDDYRDLIKSDVADVKNSGGRAAGTITAAWFLKEFVEGYPWAHLDIAATAYSDKESPAIVKGPTAMGVRLFCEFVLARG